MRAVPFAASIDRALGCPRGAARRSASRPRGSWARSPAASAVALIAVVVPVVVAPGGCAAFGEHDALAPADSGDGGFADGDGGSDAGNESGQDGGGQDGGGQDGGARDDAGALVDGGAIENPWGFAMRVPRVHVLPCSSQSGSCPGGTAEAADIDHVCTLTAQGRDAIVYVRATPTSIDDTFFPIPIYDDVQGYALRDGGVVAVPATFDIGGNHRNLFFTIELDGARITYDHSTYGFGFRACRPPDCVKVEVDGGGGGALTNGCQPARTLPEACILVAQPLPPLVDDFAPCPGDTP